MWKPYHKKLTFLGGFCFHLLLIYLYTRWPVRQRTCTLAACSLGCLFLGCLGLCSSGSMDHSEPLKSRCWSSCVKISKDSALVAPASKPSYPLKKMVRFFLNMLLLVKAFLLNISAPLQTSSLCIEVFFNTLNGKFSFAVNALCWLGHYTEMHKLVFFKPWQPEHQCVKAALKKAQVEI